MGLSLSPLVSSAFGLLVTSYLINFVFRKITKFSEAVIAANNYVLNI